MEWSVETAQRFANQGQLEVWVHSYLSTGNWINLELANGLKQSQRWWVGPLPIAIEHMIRTCGPEPEMPFLVISEHWEKKTDSFLASHLDDTLKLPPVILENVKGCLYLRDGNHRAEAARKKGWQSLWAIIWFNSKEDFEKSEFLSNRT